MNGSKVVKILIVIVTVSLLVTTLASAKPVLTLTWVIVCEQGHAEPATYQGKHWTMLQGFGKCKVLFRPGSGKSINLPGAGGIPDINVTPTPNLWPMPPGVTPDPWMPPCVGC